jgi:sulfur-carrier protein
VTVRLRLPRLLSDTVKSGVDQEVEGSTVGEVLLDLFGREPGVRNHILDESGEIRPHVSVFVDGAQANLATMVAPGADVRVLHAVSGG